MGKICFLMDSIFSVGGVQRVTAVIAKELAKGNDVTIITFDKEKAKDTSLYGLQDANIHYVFVGYPQTGAIKNKLCKAYSALYRKLKPQALWASNLYAHSSFPAELRNVLINKIRKGQFDVVIGVHAPLAARLATMKPKLNGTECFGWIHNSFEALYGPTSTYIGPTLKRHYVYQLQKLDRVVVLCEHDAESYHSYDAKFRPTVIYNPLTLVPGERSKGNSKRFLAVGRFSRRHKGFDLLIDAFHLFAKQDKEWMLDIVGEGPEEEIYRKKIAEYGLDQRVILHPFTHHIQEYYSNAQIYVLSSRWEGFGLVLVEAMAHGLPVISSDLPTSKEIMGDFGLYFENGNVEQLAQRLADATRINWVQKSAEAIEIAKRFNIDSIIKQWKAIIDE